MFFYKHYTIILSNAPIILQNCTCTLQNALIILKHVCGFLKQKLSKAKFLEINDFIKKGDFRRTTENLLKNHYDKMYEKSVSRHKSLIKKEFNFSTRKKDLTKYIKDYVRLGFSSDGNTKFSKLILKKIKKGIYLDIGCYNTIKD